MSQFETKFGACRCTSRPEPGIDLVIHPHLKDLGGFQVRRSLPSQERKMIGPFIFFDHLGPAQFEAGSGIDVRPHPHINLATVTYLFEGEILHRDNLGSVQPIRPGDIHWMTAGSGIVHSERTPSEVRGDSHRVHALQLWVALPEKEEETSPDFSHYPAADLPTSEEEGVRLRVMVGRAYGLQSPVRSHSPAVYVDIDLQKGAELQIPVEIPERGIYLVGGEASLDGHPIEPQTMNVLTPTKKAVLTAQSDARLVLIGGDPLGDRHIVWNFVSSRPERIEQAKEDWRKGNFAPVPGDTEFIPLPD